MKAETSRIAPLKEDIAIETLDNVYHELHTFEALYAAYIEAKKGKSYRFEILRYTSKLEPNLFALQRELMQETYEVGEYRPFYIHDPKTRLVMAVPFRDRITQWIIYERLYDFFDKTFIEDSYACRRGKGSHAAADKLQYWLKQVSRKPSKWYYLKLDISKYFYRIDHDVLLTILARRIKDPQLLGLLSKVINSSGMHFGLPRGASPDDCPPEMRLQDVGIPIGNLTSQLFANTYLNELDQYCKHVLKCHHYVRYMDDIIILSDDKKHLHDLRQSIAKFIDTELHLDLNKKTVVRPVSLGIDFVGYNMWATHRKLKKQSARRIIRKVKQACYLYLSGKVTLDTIARSLASYNGILLHCNSHGIRLKLESVYQANIGLPLPWPKSLKGASE